MRPNTKVTAGGLAGAFTVILVFVIQAVADIEIPAEVAAAITTILTFGTAYLVPDTQAT